MDLRTVYCLCFKMVILRWVAVNMLLTNRKHSRPFFIIFFDIEVSKVRPKLTFMRKKKEIYIWTPLCHIFYVVIKKIFHSYLINDKVQSKLVSILLSLLLQSLFFVVLLLSRMNLFYKENCQVQFITWGGNGHLHIVTLLTIKLSMIL